MSMYNVGLPNQPGKTTSSTSSGSRWITNPRQLNKVSVLNSLINIKLSSSTANSSSIAGFFTALALRGAQTSIAAANTFVTVASLTGSGFLTSCISPTHTVAFTPTIRITVDGTVYTITPTAAQPLASRMILGSTTSGASVGATEALSPNGGSDNGFINARVGGLTQIVTTNTAISLVTPEAALSYGFPVLRFESSLIIEMKCDLLSAGAVDIQCGATYILDL